MSFKKTGDVGKVGKPIPLDKVDTQTDKSSKKVPPKKVPRKQGK